jgi:hypothetical protein
MYVTCIYISRTSNNDPSQKNSKKIQNVESVAMHMLDAKMLLIMQHRCPTNYSLTATQVTHHTNTTIPSLAAQTQVL